MGVTREVGMAVLGRDDGQSRLAEPPHVGVEVYRFHNLACAGAADGSDPQTTEEEQESGAVLNLRENSL